MANQVTIRDKSVVRADLSAWRQLAADLKAAGSDLSKELKQRLAGAAEVIAGDARTRAEAASVTIPPSIKVRVAAASVSVVAGGPGVPLAGLMELGNKGASEGSVGGSGTFRHPVFGRWVPSTPAERMHPYLVPALQSKEAEFERAATDVVDVVTEKFARGG